MRGPYEGKYRKLTEHLMGLDEFGCVMTFEQIEEVLGFKLPTSARAYQAWWANQLKGQSLAWLRAGFKTTAVIVEEERLTFLRLDHPQAGDDRDPFTEGAGLTLHDAKQQLAVKYGVDPSQVVITITV